MLVSVIIPVYNGSYWLQNTLNCIFNQQFKGALEVIVIDSGSIDNSLDIICNFNVKLIQIDSNKFNHGLTRNLGVQAASGEFVVFTVQDASPADEYWIQSLLNCFDSPDVAGVCGNQIVKKSTLNNPVEWHRPISEPSIQTVKISSLEEFENLSSFQKKELCSWDNVTACYKRNVLLKLPFKDVQFGEDFLWAKEALLYGYTLKHTGFAKVYHYHFEDFIFSYKRTMAEIYMHFIYVSYIPTFNFRFLLNLISGFKILFKEKITYRLKFKWFKYNFFKIIASQMALIDFKKQLRKNPAEIHDFYFSKCLISPQATKPNG